MMCYTHTHTHTHTHVDLHTNKHTNLQKKLMFVSRMQSKSLRRFCAGSHIFFFYVCSFISCAWARLLMASAVIVQQSIRQGKEAQASRRRSSPNSLTSAGRRHRKSWNSASCWASVQRDSRMWKSWCPWPTMSKLPGEKRSGMGQEKKKADSRKSTTWWRNDS